MHIVETPIKVITVLHRPRTSKDMLKLKEIINCFLTDRLGGKEAWRPTHFS